MPGSYKLPSYLCNVSFFSCGLLIQRWEFVIIIVVIIIIICGLLGVLHALARAKNTLWAILVCRVFPTGVDNLHKRGHCCATVGREAIVGTLMRYIDP
jgi:hypothetical protein